jgi:hypothetical protein
MLGNYHHAPLNARRVTANVHPHAASRGDLHSDPIYIHHPSARSDLQSPLALTPASPSHAPILIDNYYITGVHSTNSSASINFYIYLYLSKDYDSDNDLYSLISDQLKIVETAGYLTSPTGMESITITADTNTTPILELDDELIHNATHVHPPSGAALEAALARFAIPKNLTIRFGAHRASVYESSAAAKLVPFAAAATDPFRGAHVRDFMQKPI